MVYNQALRMLNDPVELQQASNAITQTVTLYAQVENGALSIDKFIQRDQRILHQLIHPTPSQWIAIGYSDSRHILFETRIHLPSEIYSGPMQLTLPNYDNLEKIELRYQPELFAIEFASPTQARVGEAAVRLLTNSSVHKGTAFRPVTPVPNKRLITLQKISGNVSLSAVFNESSQTLYWQQGHSSGLQTQVAVYIGNGQIRRILKPYDAAINSLGLTQLTLKSSEAAMIEGITVVVSDGWNTKESELKTEVGMQLNGQGILPRQLNDRVYWADIDWEKLKQLDYTEYSDNRTLRWSVNGKISFRRVPLNYAVLLPPGTDKASIELEFEDDEFEM